MLAIPLDGCSRLPCVFFGVSGIESAVVAGWRVWAMVMANFDCPALLTGILREQQFAPFRQYFRYMRSLLVGSNLWVHTSRCFLRSRISTKRDMCVPFKLLRQVHIHIELCDGILYVARFVADLNRIAYAFDADFVDCDAPRVGARLHVDQG